MSVAVAIAAVVISGGGIIEAPLTIIKLLELNVKEADNTVFYVN
jgi:hypothetical protein